MMEIYFDTLVDKHGYDRFVLQQVWDETNIVIKNAIMTYKSKQQTDESEPKIERTCPYVYTKGENSGKSCGIKIKDKNRQMCYRHTKELQTKKKSNHEKHVELSDIEKHVCPYVITKGSDTGKCCGVHIKNPDHTHCHKHYKKALELTKNLIDENEITSPSPVQSTSTPIIPMSPPIPDTQVQTYNLMEEKDTQIELEVETENVEEDEANKVVEEEEQMDEMIYGGQHVSVEKDMSQIYKSLGLDSDSEEEDEIQPVVGCGHVFKKGKYINTTCGKPTMKSSKFCNKHN